MASDSGKTKDDKDRDRSPLPRRRNIDKQPELLDRKDFQDSKKDLYHEHEESSRRREIKKLPHRAASEDDDDYKRGRGADYHKSVVGTVRHRSAGAIPDAEERKESQRRLSP